MSSTFPHSLAAKLVGLVLTVADAPPKFDVAPGCSCMNDEESARRELVQKWSKFKPEDRTRCVSQAGAGGMPSFVEVLECLLVTVNVGNPP